MVGTVSASHPLKHTCHVLCLPRCASIFTGRPCASGSKRTQVSLMILYGHPAIGHLRPLGLTRACQHYQPTSSACKAEYLTLSFTCRAAGIPIALGSAKCFSSGNGILLHRKVFRERADAFETHYIYHRKLWHIQAMCLYIASFNG